MVLGSVYLPEMTHSSYYCLLFTLELLGYFIKMW